MPFARRFRVSAAPRQARRTGGKGFHKGKKGIEPTQCLLYIGLLTVTALLTLIGVIAVKAWIPIDSFGLRYQGQSELPNFFKQNISSEAKFQRVCDIYVQTYTFQDGKVRWEGIFSYMTRGVSMHCLLARAAKRLGPDFQTTIRIGLADMDVGGQLTFHPASKVENMTRADAPLLFPDPTFESWPEVHDYSLPQTIRSVTDAARLYGLPGTVQWERRNANVVWRGAANGKERAEFLESTSPLLDVQSTSFNITDVGFKLSSSNQISRSELCRYRFLLHMNGIFNNRYSSSVKWKLLCGSLVFVPTEPLFVEWWNYGVWQPNVHYVPYTSLPDLLEKVEYYSNNLQEAAIIAHNGMELAQDAFRAFPDWVDDTLVRYAIATKGKDGALCTYKVDYGKGEKKPASAEFMSLEELQKKFGPTLCA
jgi:hypothetical protein